MNEITIKQVLNNWNGKDIKNLGKILEIEKDEINTSDIEEKIKWFYHSDTLATTQKYIKKGIGYITRNEREQNITENEIYRTPYYDDIVLECAKKLSVDKVESIRTLEAYINDAVIFNAIKKMDLEQRHEFFTAGLDARSVLVEGHDIGVKDGEVSGAMKTAAVLSAANAAGFSLYTSAVHAVGLATHAVGVTLPFVAYTGLTSTIAFVLGPVGWLGAGFWAFLNLTGPQVAKLIPAVVYISFVNSRKQLQLEMNDN